MRVSTDKKLYPAAALLEERQSLARGWQIVVNMARETGKPLYHVRSSVGTTLDMVATIQEARKIADREHGSSVYELTATGQRRLVL